MSNISILLGCSTFVAGIWRANSQPNGVRCAGVISGFVSRIDRDIKVNARTYTATYDADGNMVSRDGDPITWTTDNLPASISSSTGSSSFNYDPEDQRYYQAATLNGVTTDTTYVGNLFEVVASSTNGTEFRHNIVADGQVVAVHTINQGGHATTAYLHYDHLGSVDAITNTTGSVIQAMSFDAFGNRRLATNWDYGVSQDTLQTLKNYTDRGYTGEEELDSVSLVDLNGRVYDPTTGRFISADPIMGGNRYAYAYNNPLEFTDPTGFCVLGCFWQPQTQLDFASNALNAFVEHLMVPAGNGIMNYAPELAAAAAAFETGGATSSSLGSGFWGAVGSGAVAGGTYSGTDTALRGGNGTQVLDNTFTGAAYGAVGGALSYGSQEYLGSGYTSSVASGAVNGYMQTGTLQGAFLGGVSGLVPYNLGMPDAYANNPWENFGIREGVAFIRGGIINGSLGGAEQEAFYVGATEGVGFAVGYGSELINGNLNSPSFQNGAWFFTGAKDFTGWFTIGNVITGPYMPGVPTLTHELDHATWQSAFGRNYLPVSLISVGGGALTDILSGEPIGDLSTSWGAFAEHWPFQACSYTYLAQKYCPQ